MLISFVRLTVLFALFSIGLISCAELKEAGRTIGHTTRNVTRDVVTDIGHGTRRVVNSIGQETEGETTPQSDDKQ
jgi:hypothetical protein